MSHTWPEIEIPKKMNDLSIAIIVAQFNGEITSSLAVWCERALEEAGVPHERRVRFAVPGAVEIPLAAATAAQTGKFQAIIALGAIIKGETDAYEHDCRIASDGIMRVNLKYGIPVIFGILTCQTRALAEARAKQDKTNTGYYCGRAVLATIKTLDDIRHGAK